MNAMVKERPVSDESDTRFLSNFPEGSPEREYHTAVLRVIRSVPFPVTERVGFALQWVLRYEAGVAGDIDLLTHPVAGSNKEDAALVSHVFARAEACPVWWLERFDAMDRDAFDWEWIQRWKDAFKAR
jgi:hypothetical protein